MAYTARRGLDKLRPARPTAADCVSCCACGRVWCAPPTAAHSGISRDGPVGPPPGAGLGSRAAPGTLCIGVTGPTTISQPRPPQIHAPVQACSKGNSNCPALLWRADSQIREGVMPRSDHRSLFPGAAVTRRRGGNPC